MFTLYFSLLSVQYYVYKQNIHILIKNTLLLKKCCLSPEPSGNHYLFTIVSKITDAKYDDNEKV